METLLYTLGLIILLSVWAMSGIILLSYTKLETHLKYAQAILTFPLVGTIVALAIFLSAKIVRLTLYWFSNAAGSTWFVLLMVILSFVVVIPVVVLLFRGWLKLLLVLDLRLK